MKTKQNKSSYTICTKDNKRKALCQGIKPRSTIYYNQTSPESLSEVYVKREKKLIEEFELPYEEGEFGLPPVEQYEQLTNYFKKKCWLDNNRATRIVSERQKKLKKPKDRRPDITHRQVRLLYIKYHQTVYAIAKHWSLSRKKVKGILAKYKSLVEGDPVIDALPVQRRRKQNKYENENDIINYIKNIANQTGFDRSITVKEMANLLFQKFGPILTFRTTKTAQLMQKAGLRFKKVKTNITSSAHTYDLTNAQKEHLLRLTHAIAQEKLIIYIDETYVSNQLIPKRLWFLNSQEASINILPKDRRATIVAACTIYNFEMWQIIYDSIDSVHYSIFLLTLYEFMRKKYSNRQLIFIHDNARPHVGKLSKELFSSMPFVRQAAYSPKMNLIEYGFGAFKKIYRRIQYQTDGSITQEKMILQTFEKIGRPLFKHLALEMFDYLLKELIKIT